jgi:hypothetical protein
VRGMERQSSYNKQQQFITLDYMITAIILGVFAAIILIAVNVMTSRNKAKLKEQYQQALKGSNKGRALQAGRAYYAAIRDGGKLTVYDEQAINNDLATMPASQVNPTKKLDSVTQLEKLFELKEKGVLTEQEYQNQKAKILNE